MKNVSMLVWPFSKAEYETKCPNGHEVQLATGYCVSAPSDWDQWGHCPICGKDVERTVGIVDGKFVAGPIHWKGETTEGEEHWRHDVLHRHHCDRCFHFGEVKVAQVVLDGIKEGANLEAIQVLVLKVIDEK